MAASQPDEFRISLTNPGGAGFNLEWKRPDLEYRAYNEHYDPIRMERLQPPAEAWDKLWATLDEIEAWVWQPRYLNPGEAEGMTWQISVRVGGKTLHSYGDNAFPEVEPAPQGFTLPSLSFAKFLAAIRTLIGGLPFE